MSNYSPFQIRRKFQKTRQEEQIYAWYVTRRISPFFTALFLRLGWTPNQVTVISIASAIVAGFFFCGSNTVMFLLGAVFFNLMYILDGSDGELARLRKIFSKEGEYLDKLGHYLVDISVLIGINIGMYRFTGSDFFLFAILFATIGVVGNRLIYDTAIKTFYIKLYKEGIPSRSGWNKDADNIFTGWHLCLPLDKYSGRIKNFWLKKLDTIFRAVPHLGYIYDTDGLLLCITISTILDLFVPPLIYNGFKMRIMFFVAIFYSIAFPIVFLIRLRILFREKMIGRWIAAINRGERN
jgi:CDP-alcohol phosphatidyltransferase-like enzyme